MKTIYYSTIDGILLVVILICAVLFFATWISHRQPETKCGMTLPKVKGEYCQQRDHRGNIYYVSADGRMIVSIK